MILEHLDFILNKILLNSSNVLSYELLYGYLKIEKKITEENYIRQLLRKLEKDGLIEIINERGFHILPCNKLYNGDKIHITFDGICKVNSKGYKQESKSNNLKYWIDRTSIWALMIGGITASVYYTMEICKFLQSYFSSCP